jgi:hypothetical protein
VGAPLKFSILTIRERIICRIKREKRFKTWKLPPDDILPMMDIIFSLRRLAGLFSESNSNCIGEIVVDLPPEPLVHAPPIIQALRGHQLKSFPEI